MGRTAGAAAVLAVLALPGARTPAPSPPPPLTASVPDDGGFY